MVRETYRKQIQTLREEVLILGSMVNKAIDRSVDALTKRDLLASESLIEADHDINRKRLEIEERALRIIATQQPMAGDLRTIAAVLSIVTDLERMGDHAEGIAKINIMMGDEPLLKPLVDIPAMAEKSREMLTSALEAFMSKDVELARKICLEDDVVDNLYDQVYRELLTFMLADPRSIARATHLLWVAHNLERTADRVTNICERVVFMVTGQMEEMNISTY